MQKTVDVFSYAYGNAANNYGCEKGPAAYRAYAIDNHPLLHWHAPFTVDNHLQKREAMQDVARLNTLLATAVSHAIKQGHLFVTLGGDHTAAIGSWSGAAQAVEGDIGLIWFDAHMDAHTFQTTTSNNIHGMPLASLLGYGEDTLTSILTSSPILKPENVVLLGIRSYESGEHALLKKLGVKIFYMQDVRDQGIEKIVAEAIAHVTAKTKGFGISIDLDGFDPEDAPSVGTPETNGVEAASFLAVFSTITHHPAFLGMDIVEFNPDLDHDARTLQLIDHLIKTIF